MKREREIKKLGSRYKLGLIDGMRGVSVGGRENSK